jgi:hypothetical protein
MSARTCADKLLELVVPDIVGVVPGLAHQGERSKRGHNLFFYDEKPPWDESGPAWESEGVGSESGVVSGVETLPLFLGEIGDMPYSFRRKIGVFL